MRANRISLLAIGATLSGMAIAIECDDIRRTIDKAEWRVVARGLEIATSRPGAAQLADITLIRYSNGVFRARVFDLRDVGSANRKQGHWAPPLFSVGELHRSLPHATFISSAGLTKSFSEPIPAGFLRIEGVTRGSLAPKDPILNGIVCISRDGVTSIAKTIENGDRPSPRDLDACYAGFQAGPLLIADGGTLGREASARPLVVPRVVMATTTSEQTIVGFSSAATLAGMRCAMGMPNLGVVDAIGLQGDTLGGIALGPPFISTPPIGNIEATVASALVVESRSLPRGRVR